MVSPLLNEGSSLPVAKASSAIFIKSIAMNSFKGLLNGPQAI
jgi:hypothetical protein